MDELPSGRADSNFWQTHVEQFKNFTGSKAAYCRLHNIDYDQFIYNGESSSKRSKSKPLKTKKSIFAKVQMAPALDTKTERRLPEARWLSELIHNLMVER